MKVLLSDVTYSYLFPGGKQVHAERLYENLKSLGIEINYENWHDPNQQSDLIHFLGFNDFNKIKALKEKGYKLVYTHIMDGLTNKPKHVLMYHFLKNKIIHFLPSFFNSLFPWKILNSFDAIVYMNNPDRDTAVYLYNIDIAKTHIIPHAVESKDSYIEKKPQSSDEDKYLVSVGSIVERKNAIFTAELCLKNKIPIKFIGHPFNENSDYFKKFIHLTRNIYVEYLGYVSEEEKIKILQGASGFVLLSFGESGCISVYEAASAGLPLLLSNLPWAKDYENPNHLYYCSPTNKRLANNQIASFFETTKKQTNPTFTIHTWSEVAQMYLKIYKSLLEP